MRVQSPAIDWAVEERRRVVQEIAVLPPEDQANVQSNAAMTYLRERLEKLNRLISALEQAEH